MSSGLTRGLPQQVSLQSRPDCVLGYSVPLLPSLSFSQGSLLCQGFQRKISSSVSSLCFLVWVFILTVSQTVQRCRMQEGYKVSVLFPARTDFDNGFYKVLCENGLGSDFKK